MMILNAGHPERYRLEPEIVRGEVCDGVDIEGDKRVHVELILAVNPLASLTGPPDMKEVAIREAVPGHRVLRPARPLYLDTQDAGTEVDNDVVGQTLIGKKRVVTFKQEIAADEMLGRLASLQSRLR